MEHEEKKSNSEEAPKENSGDGDESETTDYVGRAESAAQRLEKANKEALEILKKQESIAARLALGGKSGQAPKEEKPKVSDADYAKSALGGKLLN